MFIFNYQIQCLSRHTYKIPFHNVSGGIDIWICEKKLKKNKDKMLKILRKKLKDQSITDILYFNINPYSFNNDPNNGYFNIIIRNDKRIELLNICRNIINKTNNNDKDDFYDYEMIEYLADEENKKVEVTAMVNRLLKENPILFNDYWLIRYIIKDDSVNNENFEHIYSQISERIRANKKFILLLFSLLLYRIINSTEIIYKYISNELKCDPDIINACFNNERDCDLYFITDYLDQYHTLSSNSITHNIDLQFKCLSDKNILLTTLKDHLHILYPYLNTELKHNPEILKLAFKSNECAIHDHSEYDVHILFQSIPSDMLTDKQQISDIIEHQGADIYRYIHDNLKCNQKIIELACEQDGDYNYNNVLPYIPIKLLDNKKFVIQMIDKYDNIYLYVSDRLKCDQGIINKVYSDNILQKIPFDKLNLGFIKYLCETNHNVFGYTGPEIRDNEKIALAAIVYNLNNYKYISDRLANDFDFILKAIKFHIYVIEFEHSISSRLADIYQLIDDKFKSHSEILEICLDNLSCKLVKMIPKQLLLDNVILRDAILQKNSIYMRYIPVIKIKSS